jgi:hypothetical protein
MPSADFCALTTDLAIPQLLLSNACAILPTVKTNRIAVFPPTGQISRNSAFNR